MVHVHHARREIALELCTAETPWAGDGEALELLGYAASMSHMRLCPGVVGVLFVERIGTGGEYRDIC